MKKDIHPKYFPNAAVTCACGNKFTIGSTKETLKVEICSNCHPLYTGAEKVLDTAGRVERFKSRQTKSTEVKSKAVKKS
jgi:large subunit ribosomal protein L31